MTSYMQRELKTNPDGMDAKEVNIIGEEKYKKKTYIS